MIRLGLSSLRPLANPSVFRLNARTAIREFSHFTRPNVIRSLDQKRAVLPGALLFRSSTRSLMTGGVVRPSQSEVWKKYAVTAGLIAGTYLGTQAILNRETRDGLSEAESSLLNHSFQYTGAGLALTAIIARSLFQSGAAVRIMAANPWVVLGVSVVGGIGSMMGVLYTSPENTVQKHAFWLAFNGFQAATLSPLFFLNPAVLSRAALYTVGVVGALSYTGATAKNETFLYLGGPLLAGLTVVALSSLAPMVLPLGLRSLAAFEAVSLYGGLAVFSGFVLYDTQKILKHARMAEQGLIKTDAMRESISLQLDAINIFIRIVQVLSMQSSRK